MAPGGAGGDGRVNRNGMSYIRTMVKFPKIAREIEARRKGVYFMDDDERAAVREGLEQARRGQFVSDEEMDAFWKRIGV